MLWEEWEDFQEEINEIVDRNSCVTYSKDRREREIQEDRKDKFDVCSKKNRDLIEEDHLLRSLFDYEDMWVWNRREGREFRIENWRFLERSM